MHQDAIRAAADAVRGADALLIGAGAGMGVDSGLPDFRGLEGVWNAYPPYRTLGLTFEEAANPQHFEGDPAFGWGFYGHRTNLYRATVPHAGFGLLRGWAARLGLELFVVTSNVDGQFQKAGFDEARVQAGSGRPGRPVRGWSRSDSSSRPDPAWTRAGSRAGGHPRPWVM